MKKLFSLLCLIILSISHSIGQDIPTAPNPPRLVNDFANQLNGTEIQALEQKLVTYNDSTSSQVTVVIVKSVQPYPIADYAFKLGREWGVGQEGKNNGVVILWASDDREVFIATGYGMEGVLPDAIAKRIVEQVILPQFRNGQYYQGLDRAADMIFKYASGEYKADPTTAEEDSIAPLLIAVIIFVILMIIISKSNKNNNRRGPGGRSSGGGPIFWPYTTYSGSGRHSGNWGGGFDSGSFGGFGGGDFGGGGAGGRY